MFAYSSPLNLVPEWWIRQMSRQLSGSFTAGFGTTAEAAARESGKSLRPHWAPVTANGQVIVPSGNDYHGDIMWTYPQVI